MLRFATMIKIEIEFIELTIWQNECITNYTKITKEKKGNKKSNKTRSLLLNGLKIKHTK